MWVMIEVAYFKRLRHSSLHSSKMNSKKKFHGVTGSATGLSSGTDPSRSASKFSINVAVGHDDEWSDRDVEEPAEWSLANVEDKDMLALSPLNYWIPLLFQSTLVQGLGGCLIFTWSNMSGRPLEPPPSQP